MSQKVKKIRNRRVTFKPLNWICQNNLLLQFQSWVHQAVVGLHQEEQPPGPGEQAVLHTRQEDGQGINNDF